MEKQKKNIADFVTTAYKAYFDIKLGDKAKSWTPNNLKTFRGGTNGKLKIKYILYIVWYNLYKIFARSHFNI